ncbi:fimbrial biogenesis chaperone [Enterobacillus tribolii]|uniref:Fimbrial chaperone protein n=1 Tax=Enterobacillus tribolii TaxID=1487935 RepID=A0A370R2X0_9GAMM|nr:molecular chaperone [Enterobacillus tribolii]MBW7984747.1 molecular chaperone [Enterobacillus tribolii]RDK96748.1 fimbrial chaperone protein [Enterobacillus tribolii]
MKKIITFAFIAALPAFVNASAVLENTRIIYAGNKDGKTVKISNNDPTPYIVQVWTDSGNVNAKPTDPNAPFVVLPPSFKMSPNSVQTVKMIYSGSAPAQDRESVFYFNMVQVPPVKQNQNAMALILKNRVKIFYRPAGLPAPSKSVLENGLSFHADARGVSINNQSPYFVSVASAKMTCSGSQTSLAADMIAPKSNNVHWKGKTAGRAGCAIEYTYINDYGGQVTASAKVQ